MLETSFLRPMGEVQWRAYQKGSWCLIAKCLRSSGNALLEELGFCD